MAGPDDKLSETVEAITIINSASYLSGVNLVPAGLAGITAAVVVIAHNSSFVIRDDARRLREKGGYGVVCTVVLDGLSSGTDVDNLDMPRLVVNVLSTTAEPTGC